MFVLSNAWRALTRSKGRTALTAFITLAVTFGTVAGLAIIQEDTNAHTTAYDQQKATLAIRPTAATWKKVSATDSASTKHYMTWTSYTEYATLVQSATNSLNFTVTETVPARVSGDLKALDGGSLGSASDDETGGQLIWRAFWTKDSAKASDLGTFEIVDGKDLSYNNQSSNPNTTGALVSEAFASANNLKVGDTLKVAAASDAKTTAKLKVRGIYKYTSESAVANPVTAARNRENAIFTNYQTFAKAGLDPQSTDKTVSGWAVPIWTWCSTPVIPLHTSPWCPPSRNPSCPPRVTSSLPLRWNPTTLLWSRWIRYPRARRPAPLCWLPWAACCCSSSCCRACGRPSVTTRSAWHWCPASLAGVWDGSSCWKCSSSPCPST